MSKHQKMFAHFLYDMCGGTMVLVTGCSGFIGFHVAKALLDRGTGVVGVDNMNSYYDVSLKEKRLSMLRSYKNFSFYKVDICETDTLMRLFTQHAVHSVCHLAAQAGVRYSLDHPFEYQKANNQGFLSVLECARHAGVENFVFASSSSVYGDNKKMPFSETDRTDTPISLYAATKKANEVTAYSYSSLYHIPCSGLRFFTVYGPWGRPDMALFLFTKAILEEKPIAVFNNGNMLRNFTYIDDIVSGILLVLDKPVPYEIYNVANNKTVPLMTFIHEIEIALGKKAKLNMMPMQPGDVLTTEADISKLQKLGYKPKTNVTEGIRNFVDWYLSCYKK